MRNSGEGDRRSLTDEPTEDGVTTGKDQRAVVRRRGTQRHNARWGVSPRQSVEGHGPDPVPTACDRAAVGDAAPRLLWIVARSAMHSPGARSMEPEQLARRLGIPAKTSCASLVGAFEDIRRDAVGRYGVSGGQRF